MEDVLSEVGRALIEQEVAEDLWIAECMTRISVRLARKGRDPEASTHPPYIETVAFWESLGLFSDGELDHDLKRFFNSLFFGAAVLVEKARSVVSTVTLGSVLDAMTEDVEWENFSLKAAMRAAKGTSLESHGPIGMPLFSEDVYADRGTDAENDGVSSGIISSLAEKFLGRRLLGSDLEKEETDIAVCSRLFSKNDGAWKTTPLGTNVVSRLLSSASFYYNFMALQTPVETRFEKASLWTSVVGKFIRSTTFQCSSVESVVASLAAADVNSAWKQPVFSSEALSSAPFGRYDLVPVMVRTLSHAGDVFARSVALESDLRGPEFLVESFFNDVENAAKAASGPRFHVLVTPEQAAALTELGLFD